MQAAAEGLVDFSQLRFYDLKWTLRLSLLLRYLDRRNFRAQTVLDFQRYTAHTSRPLTPEARQHMEELLDHYYDRFVSSYTPSQPEKPIVADEQQRQKVAAATASWEEAYGKLNDPATLAKIDAVVQGLEALRVQTAQAQLPPKPNRLPRGTRQGSRR